MKPDDDGLGLTKIEKETVVAIYVFVQRQKNEGIATPDPPSVRELRAMVGIASTCAVVGRTRTLTIKGMIAPKARERGSTTRLTDKGLDTAMWLYISGDYDLEI